MLAPLQPTNTEAMKDSTNLMRFGAVGEAVQATGSINVVKPGPRFGLVSGVK